LLAIAVGMTMVARGWGQGAPFTIAPPSLPEPTADQKNGVLRSSGLLFVEHPKGDRAQVPCIHWKTQHKEDGGGNGPCLCPRVAEHGSDSQQVPCAHPTFRGPQHGSDTVSVPCTHLKPPHPGHPLPRVPCVHKVREHASDEGPAVPCPHRLQPVKLDKELGLVFFTADPSIQAWVIASARRFADKGVWVGRPRPLNIFHREPVYGKESNKDPFWSHYNSTSHTLQIMKRASESAVYRDTIRHELGHASLGHSCVLLSSLTGLHSMTRASDRETAMCEGWAHFCALFLDAEPGGKPFYRPFDWEAGTRNERPGQDGAPPTPSSKVACNDKIEFCPAVVLWDLYDTVADGDDKVSFSFPELFKVFSPTLATLPNGPKMTGIKDYADRLADNNPKKKALIQKVVAQGLKGP
jgi:hypothetical protein